MGRSAAGFSSVVAAMLIAGCGNSAEPTSDAVLEGMQSDLTSLLAAQDSFYLAVGFYAYAITDTGSSDTTTRFVRSPITGENVITTPTGPTSDPTFWVATISNPHTTSPGHCGIYDGAGGYAPDPAVTAPRTVACW